MTARGGKGTTGTEGRGVVCAGMALSLPRTLVVLSVLGISRVRRVLGTWEALLVPEGTEGVR